MVFYFLQEENFKLQQELADLALTLNMEAQKGRKDEVVVEAYVNTGRVSAMS